MSKVYKRGDYYNYGGSVLKSSYELRWAKWFDENKIKYLYEKESIQGKGFTHTPDFWIPKLQLFLEVKGVFDEEDWRKAELMTSFCKDKGYYYAVGFKEPGRAFMFDEEGVRSPVKLGSTAFTIISESGYTKVFTRKHFVNRYQDISIEDILATLYICSDGYNEGLRRKLICFLKDHKKYLNKLYKKVFEYMVAFSNDRIRCIKNSEKDEEGVLDGICENVILSFSDLWHLCYERSSLKSRIRLVGILIPDLFTITQDSILVNKLLEALQFCLETGTPLQRSNFDFKSMLSEDTKCVLFNTVSV